MTAPNLPPVDPNVDPGNADANRERAETFLRMKLATASGSRKNLLEQELKKVLAQKKEKAA